MFDTAFLEGLFFDVFFFAGPADADFFLPAAFRDVVFPETFPAFFLLGRLRAADFFAAFLLPDFFATFLLTDFRAAGLRRAADFFFDPLLVDVFRVVAFRVEDFFLVLLTLRLFPEAFLLTPVFREDALALPAPARFRFLLAAFLAGIFNSCRSEKNAELYIGCPDMEARNQRFWRFPEAAGRAVS